MALFVDNLGLEHRDCVPVRKNSDSYFYIKVLKHWKDATWQKMAVKLRNNCVLHYNNVP